MISSILLAAGGKIFLVVMAICSGGLLYLGIHKSGVQAQRAADARQSLDAVKAAEVVRDKIAAESDSVIASDLRRNWTR